MCQKILQIKMEAVVKADPATKDINVIASKSAATINVDVKKDTMKAMNRVREKLKDLPNVTLAVSPQKSRRSFIAERLFVSNRR